VEAADQRFILDLSEQHSLDVGCTVGFSIDPGKICLFPAVKS
jgi:hypothetical protein